MTEFAILNVDDTEAIRYAKTRILQRAGFDVIEAATGAEALAMAEARPPALVLLDVKLPDISGIEVCRRIKKICPETLVLQVSAAFIASSDRVLALDSGADAYLSQPVEPAELVAAVNALLRLRRAEDVARDSNARYRLIFDSITEYAILTTDLNGVVTSWNPGAQQIFGRTAEAMTGENVAQILGAGWLEESAPDRRLPQDDGRDMWISSRTAMLRDAHGDPIGFLLILRDCTAEKQAENSLKSSNEILERHVRERTFALEDAYDKLRIQIEEREKAEADLRQAQKIEALGQLTGGIAHDFNNLLTGIIGSLELIQTRVAQGRIEDLSRYANAAIVSANRAASLTHRLLAFARRQALDPRPTDVKRLIVSMEDMIGRTLGPAIKLAVVLDADVWPTLCDPNQLESALLNLVINARDAMPDGGSLTLEASNMDLAQAGPAAGEDIQPGQYVALRVIDTGTGMPPDVAARAYDPFFTTKPIGQGTGLGLSMVHGFVKQSGGNMRIDSAPGKGTAVAVFLPRFRGDADDVEPARRLQDSPRAKFGETVLVVDDEPAVRMLISEVLSELGYTALEAADAAAGLRLLGSHKQIDLVITDVGLPGGMNGRQLADAARTARPGLNILFITGYAENAALGDGLLEPGMQVITKPFSMDALAVKIRSIVGDQEP